MWPQSLRRRKHLSSEWLPLSVHLPTWFCRGNMSGTVFLFLIGQKKTFFVYLRTYCQRALLLIDFNQYTCPSYLLYTNWNLYVLVYVHGSSDQCHPIKSMNLVRTNINVHFALQCQKFHLPQVIAHLGRHLKEMKLHEMKCQVFKTFSLYCNFNRLVLDKICLIPLCIPVWNPTLWCFFGHFIYMVLYKDVCVFCGFTVNLIYACWL